MSQEQAQTNTTEQPILQPLAQKQHLVVDQEFMREAEDWDKEVFISKTVNLFLGNKKQLELGPDESACLSPTDLLLLVNKDQREEIYLRLHAKCLQDKTKHMLIIFDFFLKFIHCQPPGMPALLDSFAAYVKAPP